MPSGSVWGARPCEAATCVSEPEKITTQLHVNSGHASARQPKRVLVDPDGDAMGLVMYVDEASGQCEICRASDRPPHIQIAGTSAVSTFNGKLEGGLSFLEDAIALRATDVPPMYALLIPAHPKKPQEVWDTLCSPRIAIFGRPKCMQMDGGGQRGNGSRADLRTGRRIKAQYQGTGARPWPHERRNGRARARHL